jgi:nicotinamide-nucleotide amidase
VIPEVPPAVAERVDAVAAMCRKSGYTVGVAESLTCGGIVAAVGRGRDASGWLRGGIAAYSAEVKRGLLGVTAELFVSEECARQLATGALRVLGADVAVSSTGAGGPDSEEGRPAGTVYLAAAWEGGSVTESHWFAGDPEQVLEQAIGEAVALLERAMRMRLEARGARPLA